MHVNKVNGKVYIGQTKKSYHARWDNGRGYGYRSRFAKAIEKYGWDEGFEHIPLIEGLTKSEADYFERFFIDFFDAQNPEFGYNLTAGGDVCPLDDPVVRENHREVMKKLSADPEWRENVREANRKKAQDPEWQKKTREGIKKRSADPEWQKNHREALKKMHADPDYRKTMKKLYADPKWQKNHSEAMKKVHADPKWHEAMKKVHADPKWHEAMKKVHADPEYQKKHREAHCKKVLCVETKIVYSSLKEAAVAVNLNYTSISKCCRGKYKTAGGYHWEYA